MDRGSITAELALALPAVVLVLAVVLLVAAGASVQLRCSDAARAGAREAALGSTDDLVRAVAGRIAGTGATVLVEREPPWVRVSVSAPVAGGWQSSAGLQARATAQAHIEP